MTTRHMSHYTDLLIKVIANTIYLDGSMAGPNTALCGPVVREEGRDWPEMAHTMVGIKRLTNVRDLAQRCIDDNVPGDFIETGVWRGGCCILMRGVIADNNDGRTVYVADSFAGLPRPTMREDEGDELYKYPELAVSEETVRKNFDKYGLLDQQVVFLKGFFQETLPQLGNVKFSLIRLDGDMYESTIVALDHLFPRLSIGGFVIVDDYGALAPCRQAVTEYRATHNIDSPIHAIDHTGIWWRKDKGR
jgi:hypothetical protein